MHRWTQAGPDLLIASIIALGGTWLTARSQVQLGQAVDSLRPAKVLEAAALDGDRKSEAQLHQHHRWAQAMTLLQVAIALAAMALLTRRKWLEYGMFGVAAAGLVAGAADALHL